MIGLNFRKENHFNIKDALLNLKSLVFDQIGGK